MAELLEPHRRFTEGIGRLGSVHAPGLGRRYRGHHQRHRCWGESRLRDPGGHGRRRLLAPRRRRPGLAPGQRRRDVGRRHRHRDRGQSQSRHSLRPRAGFEPAAAGGRGGPAAATRSAWSDRVGRRRGAIRARPYPTGSTSTRVARSVEPGERTASHEFPISPSPVTERSRNVAIQIRSTSMWLRRRAAISNASASL